MRDSKHEVLHFWFDESQPQLWFQPNEDFEFRIRERFAVTYNMAMEGLSDHWADDAAGALALCIVLDQFSRRLYAGQAAAYASDEKALMVAKKAIHKGFDQLLPHEKRFFLYMPFEHSEEMADQKRSLELFQSMQAANPLAHYVAKQKYEIFERFGRFPQRNKAMGRQSTPEEERYLKDNPNTRITF